MAKLSIIITSYNVEDYILDCLKDIAGQSLEDFEAIVVDDGSTDRSAAIADEFCRRDDRFSLIRLQDNTPGGVGTAANVGLEAAAGEYVGFADGDDRYRADMFERLVSGIDEHQTDIGICNYYVLDAETGGLSLPADNHLWLNFKRDRNVKLDVDSRKSLLGLTPAPWRKVYKRDFLQRKGLRFPEVDHFFEDNPFHWDVVLSAGSVLYLDEKLCEHRVKRAGQTTSSAPLKLFEVLRNYDLLRAVLEKHEVAGVYSDALLEWLFAQTSWIAGRCSPDYSNVLMMFLRNYYQQYSVSEMRTLLSRHSSHGASTCVAVGAFLGKESVVRDSYKSHSDRSLKSRLRVAWIRDGAFGVAKLAAGALLSALVGALNWVFEGIFLRRTSRRVREIATMLETDLQATSDKIEVMTAALLLIERRLERLEGQPGTESGLSADRVANTRSRD